METIRYFRIWFRVINVLCISSCTFRPYYHEEMHHMVISIKSTNKSEAKIFYTNKISDSLCQSPVRVFKIKMDTILNIPDSGETKYWRPIYYRPVNGYRVCFEQDGKKYPGPQDFSKKRRIYSVKMDCNLSEKIWPNTHNSIDSSWPCIVESRNSYVNFITQF